jgi:Mannosyl-glycoprotein endo-beta-N-acetylglucosaminidase
MKRVRFLYIYKISSKSLESPLPLLTKPASMRKLFFAFFLLFFLQQAFSQNINKPKMQEMYDAIKAACIEHPDFVMAQCMQETGNLACKKCCLRYHNLFGFYIKGNKCKKFSSDEECIAYYKSWQDKRYPKWRSKHPKGTYYEFLKSAGYATGDKYTKELKPKVAWVQKHLKL